MQEDKKKSLILLIIGIITLLVTVIGATFAYFSVTGANDNNTTIVETKTDEVGTISLTNETSQLKILVSATDMAQSKIGTNYYATSDDSKNYETEETNHTVAKALVTGGTDTATYSCTFDLNVSVSGEMLESLEKGDATIVFSGALEEESDLTEVAASRTVTLANLSGTQREEIVEVYVVLNNTSEDQIELAGKKLEITLSNSNFVCDATGGTTTNDSLGPIGTYLLDNPTSGLNTSLEGGLYRYQGIDDTSVTATNNTSENYQITTLEDNTNSSLSQTSNTGVANYICFGTSDKDTCTGNTNAYMYRIMGVTSSGQVKLIKKEALNETMQWYSSTTSNIAWPSSTIYSNINGSSFLTNTTYVPSGWSDEIATTTWKYGDNTDVNISASALYDIENAWTDTVSAKIGLIYAHDYFYAYQSGGLNCSNLGDYSTCATAWVHLSICDSGAPSEHEWTMSRSGYNSVSDKYYAWPVFSNGRVLGSTLSGSSSVRPVFFLESSVEYDSGTGTLDDPFIIK